ncbi:putative metal-binding motif-containing protein [Candidatus Woesearchaeota archaeon]|nr:putative metal-binding motif-containing protein [Candidatus Woesearchaeota archaeon]
MKRGVLVLSVVLVLVFSVHSLAQDAETAGPSFSISTPDDYVPEPVDKGIVGRPCQDEDGDGYGEDCVKGFDCDDADASRFPGAVEICNSIDDDCDNNVDDHLNRACGLTNTGICSFGTEQCINGNWTGCTAILPSSEMCGNGLDDDCDGGVDEDCAVDNATVSLPADELALKQFLDMRYGRGNYSLEAQLENYRKTKEFMNIRKSSVAANNRTKITIEVVPVQGMYDLTVYEYIPKFIASSADKIRFSVKPEVIQSDPLVAWHFAELTGRVDLSYEIDGEIEGAAQKASTIAVAEDIRPITRPWYFDLLPLLFIPVVGLVFIFLVDVVRRRKV